MSISTGSPVFQWDKGTIFIQVFYISLIPFIMVFTSSDLVFICTVKLINKKEHVINDQSNNILQTIAVISVEPLGVVQFGSTEKVSINLLSPFLYLLVHTYIYQ